MIALAVPAFNALKRSGGITKASYDITGALDAARTYAIANNTHVWVGIFEEDVTNAPTTTPRPAGAGRIVISAVASADGTRYKDTAVDASNPPKFDNSVNPRPPANPVTLIQLGKLLKVENAHIASTTTGPSRPAVAASYRVGDDLFKKLPPSFGSTPVLNPTTFAYPLTGTAQYVFNQIIEFNPRGEAIKILDFPTPWIEILLQPMRGNTPDVNSTNFGVIHVAGLTGQTRIYRP